MASIGYVTAADRLTRADERTSLYRRPRLHESVIRYILFLCGLVSILTTVSIVFVLGNESLRFFTRWGFLNSNQELVVAVSAEDTTLELTAGGMPLHVDQIIQIGEEMMRIVQVIDADTIVVERGVEETRAATHDVKATLFVGERVSIIEFLTHTKWQPQIAEFGVLPLVLATFMTSILAMFVAGPVGLGVAIYLSEYASARVRAVFKPVLEILAGIPTVVYGYFALTFMTPLLRGIFGQETVGIYNMASAGLVMGVMIIPTISSISEDALSAVPRSLREASYGLGATRLETVSRVLLPAALSGILAAFILGIARAVGETMIVAIASGAGPNFTLNPFEAAETMTGHIARISTGDLSFNSIDYNSLFAIGLTLFIITLGLNVVSNTIRLRFREVYE